MDIEIGLRLEVHTPLLHAGKSRPFGLGLQLIPERHTRIVVGLIVAVSVFQRHLDRPVKPYRIRNVEPVHPGRPPPVVPAPVLDTVKTRLPQPTSALVFNTRRKIFSNPLVREALAQVFDFEWANKNLFHNLFNRTQGFFSDSES